jgi:hypothetical protein
MEGSLGKITGGFIKLATEFRLGLAGKEELLEYLQLKTLTSRSLLSHL